MKRIILLFALSAVFSGIGLDWAYAQPDPNCAIKGVIGPEDKKLYLLPDHELYNQITVYLEKGEKWFCSQKDAERAGFHLVPNPGQAGRSTRQTTKVPAEQGTVPIENPTPAPPQSEVTEEISAENVEQIPEIAEQVAQSSEAEETEGVPEPNEPPPSDQVEPTETSPDTQPDIQWEQTEMPEGFGGEMSQMQVMMMLAPALLPVLIIGLVFLLLGIICLWILFKKADQPAWLSLIPFVNMFILVKISGKPGWWFLVIIFVPFIGQILYILSQIALAERFGKGALFGIGLIFLPMIFYPILAFGSAEYEEIYE